MSFPSTWYRAAQEAPMVTTGSEHTSHSTFSTIRLQTRSMPRAKAPLGSKNDFSTAYSPFSRSRNRWGVSCPASTREAPAARASISNSPAMTSTGAINPTFWVR